MKATIAAGSEFDTLTAEELRDELSQFLEQLQSGYLRPPRRMRIEAAGKTDGSGNMTLPVYQVEQGFVVFVNRLLVISAGNDFHNPYTATAGGINILRGTSVANDVVDGYSFGGSTSGSLPAVLLESESKAVIARSGELLQVQLLGGPVSTAVQVHGHGLLTPLEPD